MVSLYACLSQPSSIKHFILFNVRSFLVESRRNSVFRSARDQKDSLIIPYLSQSSVLLWRGVSERCVRVRATEANDMRVNLLIVGSIIAF